MYISNTLNSFFTPNTTATTRVLGEDEKRDILFILLLSFTLGSATAYFMLRTYHYLRNRAFAGTRERDDLAEARNDAVARQLNAEEYALNQLHAANVQHAEQYRLLREELQRCGLNPDAILAATADRAVSPNNHWQEIGTFLEVAHEQEANSEVTLDANDLNRSILDIEDNNAALLEATEQARRASAEELAKQQKIITEARAERETPRALRR